MSEIEEKRAADDVVSVVLAKRNAEELKSYLERGRRFRELSAAHLGEKFKEAVRTWSRDLRHTPILLRDVISECEMRGARVPQLAATAEWPEILAALKHINQTMSQEQREEMGLQILSDYEQIKKEQQ